MINLNKVEMPIPKGKVEDSNLRVAASKAQIQRENSDSYFNAQDRFLRKYLRKKVVNSKIVK